MMRLYKLPLLLLLCTTTLFAQQTSSHYKQFLLNPYTSNPAYVGINNKTEINIAYRKQWTSFKDAPAMGSVNFQTQAADRVAFGFSINTNQQVLISNTTFISTFGYILPISKHQSLRFGLSGGIGLNKMDMTVEELNTPDPAIRNAATNNFYLNGNFGMLYSLGGLRLGFALTELFHSDALSTNRFNRVQLSNLKNRLFSASYKFYVGQRQEIAIEPYALYRQNSDKKLNSWEVAGLVHFKNLVWAGTSYNQRSGIAILMGIGFKDRFKLSYSYEFPPFKSAITATSSHELLLGIRFNTKRSQTLAHHSKPIQKSFANEPNALIKTASPEKDLGHRNPRMANPEIEPIFIEPLTKVENKKIDAVADKRVDEQRAPLTKSITKAPVTKAKESFTITKGHHYVVVSVFSVMSHSVKFAKEMIKKGHAVSVILHPKNNFYYVYIYSSTDLSKAKRFRNEYKLKNLFKEVWVFSPEE